MTHEKRGTRTTQRWARRMKRVTHSHFTATHSHFPGTFLHKWLVSHKNICHRKAFCDARRRRVSRWLNGCQHGWSSAASCGVERDVGWRCALTIELSLKTCNLEISDVGWYIAIFLDMIWVLFQRRVIFIYFWMWALRKVRTKRILKSSNEIIDQIWHAEKQNEIMICYSERA
jgi:hypothetical protein